MGEEGWEDRVRPSSSTDLEDLTRTNDRYLRMTASYTMGRWTGTARICRRVVHRLSRAPPDNTTLLSKAGISLVWTRSLPGLSQRVSPFVCPCVHDYSDAMERQGQC